MHKSIELFIVEGPSDKESFENILTQLSSNKKIKFEIIHGDVTTKSKSNNIVKTIGNIIYKFLNNPKNKYKAEDITKVVHLIDIDGVYMSDNDICLNNKNDNEYKQNKYFVKNINDIKLRNKNKRGVLEILAKTNCICTKNNTQSIRYECYYFSCNLEHVLHDNPNVISNQEKKSLSHKFSDNYLGYESRFKAFINDKQYATKSTYVESWAEIKKPDNAFKRLTNFNLYF